MDPQIVLIIRYFVLSVFVLTGVRSYIFCHRLVWGIKTCTSYPIVLLIRVRINERMGFGDLILRLDFYFEKLDDVV